MILPLPIGNVRGHVNNLVEVALYSSDIERRYRATMAIESTGQLLSKRWPIGCSGAANAFLALIGPSRGGAPRGKVADLGGPQRPFGKPMHMGPHVMNFDWGDHRKTRWTLLCSEMLGGSQYVGTLTALLNLDWRHSTSERAIPDEHLEDGLTNFVWPLLAELRPRLVCALTNRVWKTILPNVDRLRVSFPPCPVPIPRAPVVFRLAGCAFPTMLVKPYNHPSRPQSKQQIAELGKACSWFLGQEFSS